VLTRTLPTQVADHLRERILDGTLPSGERIVEADLATELGVSRHTLRSALQTLTFEGLLVQDQFRSTHVAKPTARDVYEIYTLRNALEAMACRLAAERAAAASGSTAAVDAAVARMRAGARDGDREAVKAADLAFHTAVVELAGHSRLREHYRLLQAQTRLFLSLTAAADYPLPEIAELHAELADAIRAGDAARADRLGGAHNTQDGEAIAASLR
jgi:DNA-binding GntR family transcriptional regulator